MTATKGIKFEGRFFWAYDVAAGVFLKHLIDEAEASEQAGEAWLSEAVSDWRAQAAIAEFGFTLKEPKNSGQARKDRPSSHWQKGPAKSLQPDNQYQRRRLRAGR